MCVPLLGQQLGPAHIGGHAAAGVGARRCSAVASTGYVRAAATPIPLATLLWAVEMIPACRLFASLPPLTVGLPRMGLGVLLLLGWAAVNGHAGHSSPPSTPSSGTWALTLGRSPTGSAHAPPGCDPGGGNTSGAVPPRPRGGHALSACSRRYGGAVDVARTDMRCARDSHRESSITSLPADGDSSVRAVRSLVDAFLAEDPLWQEWTGDAATILDVGDQEDHLVVAVRKGVVTFETISRDHRYLTAEFGRNRTPGAS